jgi:hypothetical protein
VRKPIMIAVAAMAMVIAIPSVASAGTYSTGFESPDFTSSASPGDNVDGQHGWAMTAINGIVYDEGVVSTGITGTQALRQSNAVASGDFAGQTHSPLLPDAASENGSNHVFDASYTFKSATGAEQQGLAVSVSPDDGIGGRMSYVRMEDQADGIHAFVVDNPDPNNPSVQRETPAGVYSYSGSHTVRFLIQFVPNGADIVRVFIDGVDIGQDAGVCFTTWENYFRFVEKREPPVTNSLIVMARGTSVPSVAGNGYLLDDVSFETRDSNGPAPTHCGDKPAFCSPGYWKNAPDSAWAKTGISRNATFNSTVVPTFYDTAIKPLNTTLKQVLGASGTKYGKASSPLGLNPFNAVGAALTEALPGYTFSGDASIDTCPLDGKGNWKPGADPTS